VSHPIPSITTFRDAIEAALGLHELYWQAHAVAALDDDGCIVDLLPYAGDHTIDCALDWAHCLVCNDARVASLVLLSAVGDADVRELREADIERFHAARRVFADLAVEVHDWIITNGADVRSMVFSCSTDGGWSAQRQ
jgi:hypothetical protein